MVKKELIKEITESAENLTDEALCELRSFADYLLLKSELDDIDAQLAKSREEYEKGEVVSLDEAEKELGLG
jgi:predicted transcriptional regulator